MPALTKAEISAIADMGVEEALKAKEACRFDERALLRWAVLYGYKAAFDSMISHSQAANAIQRAKG